MDEVTIVVLDKNGKIVDSYEGVRPSDVREGSIFWPEITKWLARTIRNYKSK